MAFLQVGGNWDIVQSNGFRVNIDITQTGDQLSASASHAPNVVAEEAKGHVQGTNFEMIIKWSNGTKGKYTGKLAHGPFTPPPIGFLKGDTVDLNNPQSTATWQSEGRTFQIA